MLNKLIQKDQELFLYLNGLGTKAYDPFWLFITDKWSSVPFYMVLLVLCAVTFTRKTTFFILLTVVLLITATDQLANVFKFGFERLRPCHETEILDQMRLVKSYCGGKFGYFSAHAANSFALATFFSLLLKAHFKWVPFLLLAWAILVSYSRIYIGVHYPLDVSTGIAIGMLTGWLFFRGYQWASEKFQIRYDNK